MSTIFEIPLDVGRPQTVGVTLGGLQYKLTFKYVNHDQGGWVFDMYGPNNTPVLLGAPLVTGVNLLVQYGYLNLGGRLWVQTINNPDVPPTFANLGGDGKVFWVTG